MKLQQRRTTKKMEHLRTLKTILLVMVIVLMGVTSILSTEVPGRELKVKAQMRDGTVLKGDLLQVDGKKLILYDRPNRKELVADMDQVSRLRVSKRRNLLNPLVNGGFMGILTAKIGASGDYSSKQYNGFYYLTLVPSGLVVGAAGYAFHARPLDNDLTHLPAAEQEDLLAHLKSGEWSEVIGKNWYKDGILGPIRLSWRPFFKHGFNISVNGNLSLTQGPLPGEQIASRNTLQKGTFHNENSHPAGRLHLDYALKEWLFLSAEYSNLGESMVSGHGDLVITRDGQNYMFYQYMHATFNAKVYLLGASLGIPNARGLLRGLRLETQIGLNSSSQKYQTNYQQSPTFITKNQVDPALQIGLSLELFPEESFTSGIIISYLYAPSKTIDLQGTGNGTFVNQNQTSGQPAELPFNRDIQYSFPATHYNFNGFSLGFFLQIR